jgi:hypothetical protein
MHGRQEPTARAHKVGYHHESPAQDKSGLDTAMGVSWSRFAGLDFQQFDGFAIITKRQFDLFDAG